MGFGIGGRHMHIASVSEMVDTVAVGKLTAYSAMGNIALVF